MMEEVVEDGKWDDQILNVHRTVEKEELCCVCSVCVCACVRVCVCGVRVVCVCVLGVCVCVCFWGVGGASFPPLSGYTSSQC